MNTITTAVRNGVRIIRFNRPDKRNALSVLEMDGIRKIMEDDENTNINVSVLTGTGNYFTSGLDIKAVLKYIVEKDDTYAHKIASSVEKLIQQIITYPKLLISIVNGPAIGIGTTILPLCDYVYASEQATFQTPFVKIGLNAEACSSAMFPLVMGRSKTTDLIFLGKKIDVHAAKDSGLVGQIYKNEDLNNIYKEIENIAKLPSDIVKINKKLIISNNINNLLECNRRECEMLKTTLKSSQFINSVNVFQSGKLKN